MVVSAAHFKEVTNGYEKRSDGLWVHKGQLDAASVRGTGNIIPKVGAGTEVGFVAGGAPPYGYILPYDRDAQAYRDLYLFGRSINLSTQGGALGLPAGSIGTAALAPGAAQALIGSYQTAPTFTTTTTVAWLATPVTTGSIACSGGGVQCRVEVSTGIYHSAVGGAFYSGLMIDGVIAQIMTLSYEYQVNVVLSLAWTLYYAPAAGNHTFTLGVYNATAGTLGLSSAINSTLYVTEQRR